MEAFAGSTDIALHVPDGLEAEIDPVVLERVLTNLLVNALRYGAPPIVVSARRADRHLRIAVDDRGPGVPEDFRALLFEQFTRSSGSSVPGSGLGLAIARSYALAHGGDLIYDSVSPSGARFELVLPQPEAAKPTSRIARR